MIGGDGDRALARRAGMDDFEPNIVTEPGDCARTPRLVTVLGLLAIIAAIFSYLIAYAGANALLSAELIKPWTGGGDPRLKWFAISFIILMSTFLSVGVLAGFVSGRHLRRIDEMDESEPEAIEHSATASTRADSLRQVEATIAVEPTNFPPPVRTAVIPAARSR